MLVFVGAELILNLKYHSCFIYNENGNTLITVKRLLPFFILTSLLIPAGCNQDDLCLSNQHALQTGFYSAFSTTLKDTVLKDATVYGLGLDDVPLYNKQEVVKMYLPLSFEGDETVFVLNSSSLFDTIWVVHSKELKFISRECGFTFDYKIDTVRYTKSFVDSVALFYPYVKYGENVENVKIFLY